MDFGVEAEWHYFATSHDKGPCNGVGGLLKRMATRACLQRPYQDQTQTHHQLYEFAEQNVLSLNVEILHCRRLGMQLRETA